MIEPSRVADVVTALARAAVDAQSALDHHATAGGAACAFGRLAVRMRAIGLRAGPMGLELLPAGRGARLSVSLRNRGSHVGRTSP